MGERKLIEATQLRKGNYIVMDGVACRIVDLKCSKPGKHGHSKINLTAVGILDDKKRNTVMPGHDKVEVPIINKKNAQILSISGDVASVMDAETFETFDMKIPEEMKGQCVEGSTVLYWDVLGERVMKQIKEGEMESE